jgi:3',5'-cyclic-AMP phosphodiesterase
LLKIVHVTDLHLVAPGETLWGLDPFARFDACLADIAQYHADAAFVAISGDLVDRGEEAAYRLLRERLQNFPLPAHLMLGNHDSREAFHGVFGGSGFVQSSAEEAGAVFLFLDTLKGPRSSAGLYDADRRAWLKQALAGAAGKPVFIFMHHPPFDIGHPLMDMIKLEETDTFAELLQGHDVRHIFFGHAHRTISGQWHGIPFSALPSLNHQLPLTAESVPTVYSDEPPMYSVVLIGKSQTIVHSDAFMNRKAAAMRPEDEREEWF